MPGPILFTKRLILRPTTAEDFEGYAAFCADPETMRFLGGTKTRSEAWRIFATAAGAWTVCGYSFFSVIERETGRWIGRIGPWMPEGWPGCEVGWGLASAFAGRGYAYEAAVAAMDYAVDILGWDDIIHTINPENVASIALAQRLGSSNRGATKLPAPLTDFRVDAWGQSASQWRERRGGAGR
ncbi:MAG: GNAT family N-acetyltransferase [Sphingomonas sp.]